MGFARAANTGLACAQSDGFSWVLLLNDDAYLEPGAYEVMRSAITPAVGVIGPVIYHQNKVQSAGIEVHKWGRIRNIQEHPETSIYVDALCGACMILPSWARFNCDFLHGFEDIELCLRLGRQGLLSKLVPQARCQHHGGASIDHFSPQKTEHSVYGHLRLLQHRRYVPIVTALAALQVLKEDRNIGRWKAIARATRKWLYHNS